MFSRLCRIAVAGTALVAAELAMAQASPTARQWREDLRTLKQEIETRHPNPYHQTSKGELDAAIAKLSQRIPKLSRNQIIVGMMRIAAMVGDGHTRIDPRKDEAFNFASLPVELYDFDDGIFVRAAAPEHADLVGWRVDAIGGVRIGDAVKRVDRIISADNTMGRRLLAPYYLEMPDILQALGLSASRHRATLSLSRDGVSKTVTIHANGIRPPWPPDTDISLVTPRGWSDACSGPTPVYLQAPLDYHRLIELPRDNALYVQLNRVANVDGETLSQFGDRILDRVRHLHPRSVILDLRFNQGGNGDLRNGFVADTIRTEDSDTRLFVIVGRGTFSASQFILNDLDRLTHAIFVGEPASSKPSAFGDSYKAILPKSRIAVRTSIYWWQDGQNFSPYTWIDVAAPLTFRDYAACRDPALEAALRYKPAPPIDELLFEAVHEHGAAGAKAFIEDYRANPVHRYSDVGHAIPDAAETMLSHGHKEEALIAAEAAADLLPASSEAWLVLADVSLQSGETVPAIAAARRALALDPNDRTARDLLDKARRSR